MAGPEVPASRLFARSRLADRFGSRWLASSGLALACLGLCWLSRLDTNSTLGEVVGCLVLARWGRGVKGKRPWPSFAEDAVEHQRVEVDIELEAAAEALYHRDRPGLAAADAV